MGYLFGQLESSVPDVYRPSFLCTPSLLVGRGRVGKKKGEHCSVVTKTLLCYQHCLVTYPKHSSIWAAMKKIFSTSAIAGTSAHSETGMKVETQLYKVSSYI